jgi:glycerol uptake facilitator-like aquaporin
MRWSSFHRKLAAECFGTFWLVFGGCGSAVLAAAFPELGIGFALFIDAKDDDKNKASLF